MVWWGGSMALGMGRRGKRGGGRISRRLYWYGFHVFSCLEHCLC